MKLACLIILNLSLRCLAVERSSVCFLGPDTIGPLQSSMAKYKTYYMDKIDLVAMKSVVTLSQSTLGSCAVSCSNQRISTQGSCNVYYLEGDKCTVGFLDNPFQIVKQAGSSSTLVAVNVNVAVKSQSLGVKVKGVSFTVSSPQSPPTNPNQLWDEIYGYAQNVITNAVQPFEYIQLDFGTCDLNFVQVIVFGEPSSTNPLVLGYPSRSSNLEVRIGDIALTDNGATRSTNPLCNRKVGPANSSPIWQIFKCNNLMTGRYITIQHFAGTDKVSVCEVVTYAL